VKLNLQLAGQLKETWVTLEDTTGMNNAAKLIS